MPSPHRQQAAPADQQQRRTERSRKPAQPAAITGRRPTRSVSAPANGWTTIIRAITAEYDQQAVGLVVLQLARQVARHVRQQHVVGDVEDQHQADAEQQRPPLPGDHVPQRHPSAAWPPPCRVRPRTPASPPAASQQIQPDDAHRPGDQERDPPTPGRQVAVGQQRRHQVTRPAPPMYPASVPNSSQLPGTRAGLSGAYSAMKVDAPAYSPPVEKPLHQPRERGAAPAPRHRSSRTRDEPDGERTRRHHDHREGEDLLPSDPVAERPRRPCRRAGGPGTPPRRRRTWRAAGRSGCRTEEDLAQRHGDVAVDAEVEPLHRVAEGRRLHGTPDERGVGDGGCRRRVTGARGRAGRVSGDGGSRQSFARLPSDGDRTPRPARRRCRRAGGTRGTRPRAEKATIGAMRRLRPVCFSLHSARKRRTRREIRTPRSALLPRDL